MTRSYRPQSFYELLPDNPVENRTVTVLERERSERWSGLYDVHGNKLMALEERDPVGLVWFGQN